MSSVREVLPGRDYFIPNTSVKLNPLTATQEDFENVVFSESVPIQKTLYQKFTGVSPVLSNEICYRAGIDGDLSANSFSNTIRYHVYNIFSQLMAEITEADFKPCIIYKNDEPIEFCALPLMSFEDMTTKTFKTISEVLEKYYSEKEQITRIRQRSADLRQIVQTALNKDYKKYDLQLLACTDTHSLNEKHKKGRSILQKSKNVFFDNEEEWDLTYKTYDELVDAFKKQGALTEEEYMSAIRNTNKLVDMVEEFMLDTNTKYPAIYENPLEITTDNYGYGYLEKEDEEADELIALSQSEIEAAINNAWV